MERNTCRNQPLKFNLVTLKFLLFCEALNIEIGSAMEGVSSQSQLRAGKQCPGRKNKPELSNSVACRYGSVAGLSVRPGKKKAKP